MSFADDVVSETLCAIREVAEHDPRLSVRVAALEFHSYGNWWTTPDGLIDLKDFSYKCSGPGSIGCDPMSALRELNQKLSRDKFLKDVGSFPMILIITASNGYFTSPCVEEFDELWVQLHQNTWYRHAWRFVFAYHILSDALTKETRGSQAVLNPFEPEDFALFSAFVRRLEHDPWWDLSIRGDRVLSTDEHLTLDEVMELALWRCGEEALRKPVEFLSIADDLLDRESQTSWVFLWFCDEELLEPYAQAYTGDIEVTEAARSTLSLLHGRHQVPKRIARTIAESMALGVIRAQLTKKEDVHQEQQREN